MLTSADAMPILATLPPFIEAMNDSDDAQRKAKLELIARAAQLNEARVRELIGLVHEAGDALDNIEPWSGARAVDGDLRVLKARLHAIEYGLGGLLPPVTGRLNIPLDPAVLGPRAS